MEKIIWEFKLVKYRDAGMHTYTFFYINEEERIVSPYFDSQEEAEVWLETTKRLIT